MAFTSDRRLYLSQDKSCVVEEGDQAAAYLFVAEGGEVAADDAASFGLEFDGEKVILPGAKKPAAPSATDSDSKPEPKAREKAEDKAARRSGDKGRSGNS